MLCLRCAPVGVIDESCHLHSLGAGSHTPLLAAHFTVSTEENFPHLELLTLYRPYSEVRNWFNALTGPVYELKHNSELMQEMRMK